MIGLSKYRAKTLKKNCPHSIRCVGRISEWKCGEMYEQYITIITIYSDETLYRKGKYENNEKGVHEAQETLDDLADKYGFRYSGRNEAIPEYNHYKYGGGYELVPGEEGCLWMH